MKYFRYYYLLNLKWKHKFSKSQYKDYKFSPSYVYVCLQFHKVYRFDTPWSCSMCGPFVPTSKVIPSQKLRYWHYIPALYNIQFYTQKSPQAKRLRSFINYNLVWYLLDKCDNCHPFVELIQ